MTPSRLVFAILHHALSFGDVTAMGPALAAGLLVAAAGRRMRLALLWGAIFAAAVLVTGASKNLFAPFTVTVFGHALVAASYPSGHTVTSTVFFGTLGAVAWRAGSLSSGAARLLWRSAALALFAAGAAVVLAIHVFHWHPLLDIVAGLALGGLASAAFAAVLRREALPAGTAAAVILVAVFSAALFMGTRGEVQAALAATFPHLVI